MLPTARMYLDDELSLDAQAAVLAVRSRDLACDRSPFYPGGGGQPPDSGIALLADGTAVPILAAQADELGVVWHACTYPPPVSTGQSLRLLVDGARRRALSRYHTALHVLNTLVQRDFGGWITGAFITTGYARIDFSLEGFSPTVLAELESGVNVVLARNHRVRAFYLSQVDFERHPELLRTRNVQPPVTGGRVRVVEIEGFDAQACGGTHVQHTADVGHFTILRTENKGKNNKRLYVGLESEPKT